MTRRATIAALVLNPVSVVGLSVLVFAAGCGAGLQDRAVDRVAIADAGEDGDFVRPFTRRELRRAKPRRARRVVRRSSRTHRPARAVARTRSTRKVVPRRTVKRQPVRRSVAPLPKPAPKRMAPKRTVRSTPVTKPVRRPSKVPTKRSAPTTRRSRPAGPGAASHKTPRVPAAIGRNAGLHRLQWAANRVGTVDKPNFLARAMRAGGPFATIRTRPFAKGLHRRATRTGTVVGAHSARPGDLVFFRNTHDLNGNGRPDDGITWAGIVERVDNGRIIFIARRAGKVRRMAVTPSRPNTVRADGNVLNTRLVRWPGMAAAMTSGQCFAGIARL